MWFPWDTADSDNSALLEVRCSTWAGEALFPQTDPQNIIYIKNRN